MESVSSEEAGGRQRVPKKKPPCPRCAFLGLFPEDDQGVLCGSPPLPRSRGAPPPAAAFGGHSGKPVSAPIPSPPQHLPPARWRRPGAAARGAGLAGGSLRVAAPSWAGLFAARPRPDSARSARLDSTPFLTSRRRRGAADKGSRRPARWRAGRGAGVWCAQLAEPSRARAGRVGARSGAEAGRRGLPPRSRSPGE